MNDKTIRYRITTGAGNRFLLDVGAETINDGFAKAAAKAIGLVESSLTDDPSHRELNSVEFWEVVE